MIFSDMQLIIFEYKNGSPHKCESSEFIRNMVVFVPWVLVGLVVREVRHYHVFPEIRGIAQALMMRIFAGTNYRRGCTSYCQ